MMRKSLYPVAALIVLFGLAHLISAQDQTAKLTGYLVDKACSARVAKNAEPMTAASNHKRGCALMENCAASGFGVFADGKYYEFDQKGNELAKGLLEESKREKGIKVSVEGKVHESHLMVEKISEVE